MPLVTLVKELDGGCGYRKGRRTLVKATLRKNIEKFTTEMILWNFDSALRISKDFKDFPQNAYNLIRSLTTKFDETQDTTKEVD